MVQHAKIVGTPNFYAGTSVTIDIKKAPMTSLMVQEVTLPDLSTGFASQPTPFRDVNVQPDKLIIGDLRIRMKLEENLENYIEIVNWIKGVTFPKAFDQYKAASAQPDGDGIYSDIFVTLMTNTGNPNIEFQFLNCFPVDIGGFNVETSADEVPYISVDVTFKTNDFQIKKLR